MTSIEQQQLWVVETIDDDGDIDSTAVYGQENADKLASRLRAVAAARAQAEATHDYMELGGAITVRTYPLHVTREIPVYAVVYTAIAARLSPEARAGFMARTGPGVMAETVEAPDRQTLAGLPGVSGLRVAATGEQTYHIAGPDPEQVHTEQMRLMRDLNPEVSWGD